MKLACDRCGKTLLLDSSVRYRVRIEVFAAYDPMEISAEDLERDNRGEMRRLIERLRAADPEEVQDTVYRRLAFDLCPECQRVFLRNPLGREAAESAG